MMVWWFLERTIFGKSIRLCWEMSPWFFRFWGRGGTPCLRTRETIVEQRYKELTGLYIVSITFFSILFAIGEL